MNSLLNVKIFPLLLVLLFSIPGCDKKDKIVGTWSGTESVEGVDCEKVFVFDSNGNFELRNVPLEANSIGYRIEGTWELDLFGKLKLSYKTSSLEAIATPDFYDPDGSHEKMYLEKIRKVIHKLGEDGCSYKVDFSDNGETLKLINDDETEEYERQDDGYGEERLGKGGKKPEAKLGPGNLPTSGSVHQFDFLAEKYLTNDDLSGYTSEELRILRNAIYAMHNYSFISTDLQNYFGNFDDYQSLTQNVNLSEIEQSNVYKIQSLE